MKWNWKWAAGIGGVALLLFLIDRSPETLRGAQKWLSGLGASGQRRKEKVSRAELIGKLERALLFAAEVKERLDAYKAQFDCAEGRLLDELFFEGEWANHPMRPGWWELRRELPEFVKKHDALITELHKAKSSVSRGDDIGEWLDLPDEAETATAELDQAVKDRNRRVAAYAKLLDQYRTGSTKRRRFP
jgi:hypothetical protein